MAKKARKTEKKGKIERQCKQRKIKDQKDFETKDGNV